MKKYSFLFVFILLFSNCAIHSDNYFEYYIDAVVVPYFEDGWNGVCPVNGYRYIQISQFLIVPINVEKHSEFRGFVKSEYPEYKTKIYIDFYNAIRITDMDNNPVNDSYDTNTTMLISYHFTTENFYDVWDEVGSIYYDSKYYPVYSTYAGVLFYSGFGEGAWLRLDDYLYGFPFITNGVQLKVCNSPDPGKLTETENGLLAGLYSQLSNMLKNINFSTCSNSQNYVHLSNTISQISNSTYKIEAFFENTYNKDFGAIVWLRNELGSGIQSVSCDGTNWLNIIKYWLPYYARTEITNTSPSVFKITYFIKKDFSSAFENPLYPDITNSLGMLQLAAYIESEFFAISL
ncbi:MAG: hypothetical protein A2Y33_05860 [Spirochaetes bacterium GWF1_51_8]|nr:MAG: hypothetical protein A2Y33_05860 [Spirochaetes bacterium GWF1_51_8]